LEDHLGTQAYARLRAGVGRPAENREAADHVLEKFTPEERPVVARMVETAVKAVESWRTGGLEAALSVGNQKVEI